MNFTRSESAHYYFPDGKPCFEVDGKKTTILECRKMGLLPSAKTILKLYPSFGLKDWLKGQFLMSAHSNPRFTSEPDGQWLNRLFESTEEESAKARTVGTQRRQIIGGFHDHSAADGAEADDPFVEPYLTWFKSNIKSVLHSEHVVINTALGYAGHLDLYAERHDGRTLILDVRNRSKVTLPDTDILQLAACQRCLRPRPDCISVVLGTAKPDILVREWNPLQMREAWETFKLLLQLWKRVNNYESRLSERPN